MESPALPIQPLHALCLKWRVQELSLIGSALTQNFGAESDYDFLVRFLPEAPWDLWEFALMREEFSTLLERPVDLIEIDALRNPLRKRSMLHNRRILYAA